ncbi:hypothetical protein GWK47_009298 [Chionoecetes opilio]|uniref:Uncharacterized protein n=1 Tax=Chionoecetes opilio TaxID=41210 RepID=A0A8J5CNP4_CHIOP|nr:hypothetical protein GWK47_009298 [Chionoecetes opilio]
MIEAFQKSGCLMSIRLPLPVPHMEKVPENLGAMSDEQWRERCHQDMRKWRRGTRGCGGRSHDGAGLLLVLKRDNPAAAHTGNRREKETPIYAYAHAVPMIYARPACAFSAACCVVQGILLRCLFVILQERGTPSSRRASCT